MTCLETQRLITPFINEQLTIKELEDFSYHVNHCDSCKEELEVYYTLLTGMKLLDEEKNINNNFHVDLELKLKRAEERIIKHKINFIRKKIGLVVMIILIGFLSSMGIEEIAEQELITNEKKAQTNNYNLRTFFVENKNQYVSNIYFEKYQKIVYDIKESK